MKVGDIGPARSVVTDHAILRFLERVYGVDIEMIRHEIAAATARGRELGLIGGHRQFDIRLGEVRFVIQQGVVVTTILKSRHRRTPLRRRRVD